MEFFAGALVLFGPGLAAGAAAAVATRHLLLRSGVPRGRAIRSAAWAASATVLTWLVFGFDWFASALRENEDYALGSPYADYRRSVHGESALVLGVAYALFAGALVAAAAWLYERARSDWWLTVAVAAAGSVVLPAVVPAALPRTAPPPGHELQRGGGAAQPPAPSPTRAASPVGDAAMKASALRVARHMRACRPAHRDFLPCLEPAQRAAGAPIGAAAGQVEVTGVSTDDFVVIGHSSPGRHFTVGARNLRPERFCHPRGWGGCPASGRW